jgi:hypothetical protein
VEEAMDFSLELGREVLRHTPVVLQAMLSDLSEDWIAGDTEPMLQPVDREAGFIRFRDWKLGDLLDRFATVRTSNLATLATLVKADDLGRRGVHPTFGEVTLGQLLATWVVHDLNHLGQIVRTMAKQYSQAVGPWSAFLPIVNAP